MTRTEKINKKKNRDILSSRDGEKYLCVFGYRFLYIVLNTELYVYISIIIYICFKILQHFNLWEKEAF